MRPISVWSGFPDLAVVTQRGEAVADAADGQGPGEGWRFGTGRAGAAATSGPRTQADASLLQAAGVSRFMNAEMRWRRSSERALPSLVM